MRLDPRLHQAKPPLPIWWMIWGVVLAGLVLIYLVLRRGVAKPVSDANVLKNLVGLIPLFLSIVIRWLVLPRYDDLTRAFPVFIAGLALAEACGILGIFLGGPYRDDLFVLGVLGIAQFVPLFARRMLEPKGSGFIPNN
jgi:hypothetical protein